MARLVADMKMAGTSPAMTLFGVKAEPTVRD